MNGVCVRFRGWLDLERLDGIGRLEYDERRGAHEDAILKEQLERYSQRLKDFEDTKQRSSSNINGGSRGNWRQ
jgi:Core binding factor beta subunit